MILKFGSKGNDVITIQQQLKKLGFKGVKGKDLSIDGDFGVSTEHAVITFQKQKNLVADGKVGDKTRAALLEQNISKLLKDSDYTAAAARLKVSELAIRVFGAVEGRGVGFLKNGKPKILFERHRMYAYLRLKKGAAFANKMAVERPNIVNKKSGGYQGNEAEYVRLELAKQIDVECALMSASWGQFQIMGENWKDLGYASAQDFVDQQFASESFQLEAFIRFIEWKTGIIDDKKVALIDALRAENWDAVFTLYNGPNYKKLGYQAKFQKEWDHLEPIYGGAKAA
ncbi:N-acetylmuramidase family protein [Acinetobacter ursingii]|uniref:N-acetylmuramidase family protein n=1 Tax=Acinetobacter TaxID=469 RepID=UPI000DB49FD2|nr:MULTISPECIES: N-acetylmuramidase family protein [Acinetobacter]MDG9860954.1 N-acetylmuramidase family protein [Acinetobacter ursingii]MDG9892264.1 N-acetylmuramidase family protein [Acinetobacter ursingii]MDH0005977.1 N-acetylmuramidase family protein [Acinetobacter ursingii]MDH0477515.1 N-acetylmuramidase family protein [Acinetobacter ursingii]MDH2118354.1 N-acetylmuramidase family protein [Acinetobacter ursingii]